MTYFGPENPSLETMESIQIITLCVNAVTAIYVLILSVGVLMPGTLGGFFFDLLLHVASAGCSALLWKEYHKSQSFGWMMVPQRGFQY